MCEKMFFSRTNHFNICFAVTDKTTRGSSEEKKNKLKEYEILYLRIYLVILNVNLMVKKFGY